MTYDTGNPVPSLDPRDLDDNAQAFDRFMHSRQDTEPDRRGVLRLTYSYVERAATALVNPNVMGLASLTSGQYKVPMFSNSSGGMVTIDSGALGRTLLALANTAADKASGRTALGALAASDTAAYAGTAAAWTTPRTVSTTGDGSWSVILDGTSDVTATFSLSSVALKALAGVSAASNSIPYFTSGTAASKFTATSYGRGLLGLSSDALTRGYLNAAGSGANNDITSLSALVGTAFTALTLQNGWVALSGRRAVYRKYLGMLQIEMQIDSGTKTDGTLIATLPAGFRPPVTTTVGVLSAPNVTPGTTALGPRVVIGTDGTITCTNCNAAITLFAILALE